MPNQEGSASMFETVKNHEERITKLEENDKDHQLKLDSLSDQMSELKQQNTELENTVLKDNRETRSTLVGQIEKLFKLTESAMGQQHELRMMKWKTIADIFFKVCGAVSVLTASGGVVYMIVEYFISK